MRATYNVPFDDFDGYETMAKKCGCTCAYHKGFTLTVTGTQEAIDKLSGDLGFEPDETMGLEPSNERLAQAFNDSGVFKPFTCIPGGK